MRTPALALLALLSATSALAQERVGVRTGEHPGHGRIVFDWPSPPPYRVEVHGERVLLHFPDAAQVDLPRRLPRNMVSIARDGDTIEVILAPGARARHFRNGARVALDALNPAAPSPPLRSPPARRPASEAAALPPPVDPAPPASAPSAPPAAASIVVPEAPPPIIAAAPPAPVPPVAVPAQAPAAIPAPASALPAQPGLVDPQALRLLPGGTAASPSLRITRAGAMGVALFPRGDRLVLVLDEDRPFDLSRLAGHPQWPFAEARSLAEGAALVLPLPPGLAPEMRRIAGDLVLVLRPSGEASHPGAFRLQAAEGRATLPVARPGRVLVLNDPLTETPLLVGTLREDPLRQVTARAFPEFGLLQTFVGVAVSARTDRLVMRVGPDRFVLSVDGGALSPGGDVTDRHLAAASMTRFLDLPDDTILRLGERLRAEQAEVAHASPLNRAGPRFAAAQTLLALGLPQEASAMLHLAATETPGAGFAPPHQALAGIAGLLSGGGGEGLEADVAASDELTFWRALRTARAGDPRAAAPALAATLPLLEAYPGTLRRRLLPMVAETLAEGGEGEAARRVIAAAGGDQPLNLAAGMLEEAEGAHDQALEAYAAAAGGRDRRSRARALRRAAELRLRTGALDAAGAAEALEAALFSWRGDDEELALRRRIAALRQQAGDARGALAMLRETEAAFPENAPVLKEEAASAFLAALRAEPPLQAVALHDAHPEMVPANEAGEAALLNLAERLLTLDLPERAGALLARALERLPPGPARAALGVRLARLRLDERDPAGALAVLGASGGANLPVATAEARALIAARAEARLGRVEAALETLAVLGPAGEEAAAEIHAEARNFAAAAAALSRHLAATGPVPGPLPEAGQRVALRLAAMLALAGDERGIAALRRAQQARITEPNFAQAFEALTADPVRGLADLPRMARELNLFRSLPQWREPLRTAALPAG